LHAELYVMDQNKKKPVIGITMGDPAGIGPEIVARVLQSSEVRDQCVPVVIGDPMVMDKSIDLVRANLTTKVVSAASAAGTDRSTVYVVSTGELRDVTLVAGKLDARYGQAAADCCRRAVEMVQAGEIQAIVSTPVNKEAFRAAGITALDDMAFFEECFGGADDAYMVGEVSGIWVTIVTFHIGLKEVSDFVTRRTVLDKILGLKKVMESAGVASIRIGVAALNPHAGEGGMFGREEIDEISPAVIQAAEEGFDVVGPIPADSIFLNALEGEFNGLVFMYHDQANIGRKILGRERPGVTLYIGMPAPVLTVPHGTAFDIAWQGKARADMLLKCTVTAARMAANTKSR